jgi:hypothetical protein
VTVSFPASRSVRFLPSCAPSLLPFVSVLPPSPSASSLASRASWGSCWRSAAGAGATPVAQSRVGTRRCGWSADGVSGAQSAGPGRLREWHGACARPDVLASSRRSRVPRRSTAGDGVCRVRDLLRLNHTSPIIITRTCGIAGASWCLVPGFVFPPEWMFVSRELGMCGRCRGGYQRAAANGGRTCGPSVSLCQTRCGATDLGAARRRFKLRFRVRRAGCVDRGRLSQAATGGMQVSVMFTRCTRCCTE